MITPFTSFLPHLNLHNETSDISVVLLKEFIEDNIKLKNKTIVVIHGISGKIIKNTVHNYLKSCRRVKNFYIDAYNNGQTIIELF